MTGLADPSRPIGNIADVIRKVSIYEQAGRSAGLILQRDMPMVPTEAYLLKEPKQIQFRDVPGCHLLRFIKS